MVDKSRLLFRGGIRSFSKNYEDGSSETFFYKARTPNELAAHFGALAAFAENADGFVARQKHLAKFIAESICDETGEPQFSAKEAESILAPTKAEIVSLVVVGSNEIGDAGKG
jgi:hypothetical protein